METRVRSSIPGPLSPWLAGFVVELRHRGYTPLTVRDRVGVVAQLDAWLDAGGVGCDGLTPEVIDRFLAWRRARGARAYLTTRSLEPLLEMMRAAGAMPPPLLPIPVTPAELLVDRYRRCLEDERGLASRSVLQCVGVAEQFISGHATRWHDLGAGDVRAFIDVATEGKAPMTVQHLLWSLRSFLKFLFVAGEIPASLAEHVPSVRIYTATGLPHPLPAASTQALVESCDTTKPSDRRVRQAASRG